MVSRHNRPHSVEGLPGLYATASTWFAFHRRARKLATTSGRGALARVITVAAITAARTRSAHRWNLVLS